MQNRAILITLRAAAIVIIATGLNDVVSSALPRYEPLYLYLAGIALVALLDGVIVGLLTALLSLGFYALLFMPRAEVLTSHIAVPAAAAVGVAVVASLIRGLVRARSRRQPSPMVPAAPPLLGTSAVAHASDNAEVLAAIDEMRAELRAAIAELTSARAREEELNERTRGDRAEREAVELRARQLEQERDWALKNATELQRQLAESREEAASMAGRLAELELASRERETLSAGAATLRARIAALEEQLAAAAPAAELDGLRRALADTRNARDRARAEAMEEKQRAEALERTIAAARAEADGRVGEERARREGVEAQLREERATRERLEAEAAQFDTKLQTIAAHLASDHEADLGQAMSEREAARAEARALRARLADMEAAISEERRRAASAAARAAELESTIAEERRRAEAAAGTLRAQVAELESALAGERATRERLEGEAAQFDTKLQTIVTHLASDHESDLGQAVSEREEARAEARALRARVTELESALAEERATRERLEGETAQFDTKLQTIVTHLATDHESDLGQAFSEKEEARAEARALSMKLAGVQRKLDEMESLLTETRQAAQAEIDRLRAQLRTRPEPQAARPRVLVVHPDADVRATAGASLERAGYEVVGAADGLEALRVAIARQPEVVIAESSMPKMDGRELCQLLKSQDKTAHIRFILLTRAGDDPPRGELAPDEVLRKPVPVETLKATLASLMAQAGKG